MMDISWLKWVLIAFIIVWGVLEALKIVVWFL